MPRYGLIVIASGVCLNPNRSLDRKSTTGNGEDYFLTSFVFLLASCLSFVLAVARYTKD